MPEPMLSSLYALGFSWRKRYLVKQFAATEKIRFVKRPNQIPDGATVLVWASGPHGCVGSHDGSDRYIKLFLEDGFLRSVGLGADLVKPLSWVIDSQGIYYDSTRPNNLEQMLQTRVFSAGALKRAEALRKNLVLYGLTKYNDGSKKWSKPSKIGDAEVVLVVGQVETDASIRFGAPGIKTNIALLMAARARHPAAWLIYKPHPDVVAGLRNQGLQEEHASKWCDEVVTDVAMGSLLDVIDTVHVLTSLAGFEALLRGRSVVCHGQPFYAGWGLTEDILPVARRFRKLDISELVAGALIEYPTYVSRQTGLRCEVEQTMEELLSWRQAIPQTVTLGRRLLRYFIKHP